MKILVKNLELAAACFSVFGFVIATAASAQAGTIILEGSDAIGLHCSQGSDAGACAYENQVWAALEGPSSKPIAAIGSVSSFGSDGTSIPVDNFSSVSAAGTLNQYAALYFISGGGCCSEDDTLISAAGDQSAVSAYLAAGGTVMIENYTGGAAWDFAVGTSGGANGSVAGISGGSPASSDGCDDGETVTALGLSNGFTQPPTISCWEHQAYQIATFAPLGFTQSFYDAAPGMVSGAVTGWSGLLSSGSTLTGASTPEPASFLLIGVGLAGLGLLRRRLATR